jgi:hypothetical protein
MIWYGRPRTHQSHDPMDWVFEHTSDEYTKTFYNIRTDIYLIMIKVLPHVMRNINEFNIPAGNPHGYEILYFGVNLILMFDYRLSFDVEVKSSYAGGEIEVLIISRKDTPAWKSNGSTSHIKLHYSNSGERINDIFKPLVSDAYAFILSNRSSSINSNSEIKTVEVTLIHTWQQEIKESQLKNRVNDDLNGIN